MLGVGRDLCGSSSPTPLPKQGRQQQAAQDRVQVGLEYLQRRRLHNLPGQPVTVLHHPQREEVLPHVQTDLPLLQFVPIAPCPVAGHHWKESGPNCCMIGPRTLNQSGFKYGLGLKEYLELKLLFSVSHYFFRVSCSFRSWYKSQHC